MSTTIAGHTFIFGCCSCGRHWTDIRNVTHADLQQQGIAHTEQLTQSEYDQIVVARAAEDHALDMAMASL